MYLQEISSGKLCGVELRGKKKVWLRVECRNDSYLGNDSSCIPVCSSTGERETVRNLCEVNHPSAADISIQKISNAYTGRESMNVVSAD